MHLYWVGLAADLWRQDDRSLEWMLTETLAAELVRHAHRQIAGLPQILEILVKEPVLAVVPGASLRELVQQPVR
jgi:hypothetical protein